MLDEESGEKENKTVCQEALCNENKDEFMQELEEVVRLFLP